MLDIIQVLLFIRKEHFRNIGMVFYQNRRGYTYTYFSNCNGTLVTLEYRLFGYVPILRPIAVRFSITHEFFLFERILFRTIKFLIFNYEFIFILLFIMIFDINFFLTFN